MPDGKQGTSEVLVAFDNKIQLLVVEEPFYGKLFLAGLHVL
jgi:hypothetical protein